MLWKADCPKNSPASGRYACEREKSDPRAGVNLLFNFKAIQGRFLGGVLQLLHSLKRGSAIINVTYKDRE